MMLKKINYSVVFIIALIGLVSCNNDIVFDKYKDVSSSWNEKDLVSFKLNPNDSLQPYDLCVNIRNTNEYKYNNLFLIVEMDFPNGKVVVDTLEYKMAYKTGALMGEGISAIKTNKLWYKQGVKFTEQGDYEIKIQHAMRKNGEVNGVTNLEGITDVGFSIEKSK
jgi:gliding motility-associated lipoprotein GldH